MTVFLATCSATIQKRITPVNTPVAIYVVNIGTSYNIFVDESHFQQELCSETFMQKATNFGADFILNPVI